MALVPFKNLLQFLQKKCSKHLKIDQKYLSRVAKFVSHDGNKLAEIRMLFGQFELCEMSGILSTPEDLSD